MSNRKQTKPDLAVVEVVVNHDDLRRGERGEVELTDTVRGRLERGYLKLVDDPANASGVPVRRLGSTSTTQELGTGVLLGVEPGGDSGDQSGTVHTPAGQAAG